MSFSGLASLTRAPSSSVSSIGGHGRFKRLQRIGEGSFGDVFKALDTETNEVVAVKVINLEVAEEEIEEIREEITMLSECHSSYVTRYITSYTSGPELCIVMEFLGGGSVHDLLDNGPLDESYVAIIMRELLKAIDYLHSNAKIHRGQERSCEEESTTVIFNACCLLTVPSIVPCSFFPSPQTSRLRTSSSARRAKLKYRTSV